MVSCSVGPVTTIPLPDTSGEGGQAAEFTHLALVFPPAKRTVLRCFVRIKHSENTGHFVEVIFCLTKILSSLTRNRLNAVCAHSAYPSAPFGAAGTPGSLTCCLERSRHIQARRLSDAISPDGVQFLVSVTKSPRERVCNCCQLTVKQGNRSVSKYF